MKLENGGESVKVERAPARHSTAGGATIIFARPARPFHPGAIPIVIRLVRLLAIALVLPSGALSAQSFDSPWVPRGQFLIGADASTSVFDSYFGRAVPGGPVDRVVPAGFARGTAEGADLRSLLSPQPLPGETFLREVLGDPQYRMMLGSGQGVTRVREVRLPFHLGYGITDRFTVRAMVPVVRRRIESAFGVDPGQSSVGINPSISDPAEVSAFLQAFEAGLESTRGQVDQTCATAGEASAACQEGRTFVSDTENLLVAMSGAYTEGVAFPLEASDAGAALLARMEGVHEGMADWGVGFTAAPPLATAFLDGAGFESLFIDPVFGNQSAVLTGTAEEIWSIGDIELSLAIRLLDLAAGAGEEGPPGFRFLHSAGALVRLGTSPTDTLADLIGVDTQRGRSDLELQLFNDLHFGGRLGMRVDLRYAIPLDREIERFYTPGELLFDPEAVRQPVLWIPAAWQSVDVVPRILLTPELAFGFRYHLLLRGEEEFTAPDGSALPFDPAEGATDAQLHRVGGSLVYSTLEAARQGRTGFPFEVRVRYDAAVAGRGGVARTRGVEVGLKLFLSPGGPLAR